MKSNRCKLDELTDKLSGMPPKYINIKNPLYICDKDDKKDEKQSG